MLASTTTGTCTKHASSTHQSGLLTPPPDDNASFPPKQMVLRFRPNSQQRRRRNTTTPISSTSALTSQETETETATITSSSDPGLPSPHITSSLPASHAYVRWSKARPDPTKAAGAHRPFTLENIRTAFQILRHSAVDLFFLLWTIHPLRILFFLAINFFRGLLPALRSYSQSILLDQVHIAVSTHVITPALAWCFLLEICRMVAEAVFEHYATKNERDVQQSIRFRVEYLQMETRLRLDIPSLSDPNIQDLLTESDLFARSFNGIGGAIGLLSPFDLIRNFTTLTSEVVGQLYVLHTLLGEGTFTTGQIFLVGSALVPTAISVLQWLWSWFVLNPEEGSPTGEWPHSLFSPEEAETAERHERMRRLAYDDSFKSEVMLFGLGKWILKTWVETREALSESDKNRTTLSKKVFGVIEVPAVIEFARDAFRELTLTLQAIPLILQLSTTTLGSATLYRTSIQTFLSSIQTLHRTSTLTFQSIFLMGAFHAALTLQPSMEPTPELRVPYKTAINPDGKRKGIKIEARNLWFSYPGETAPVIRGLNLTVQPGEVVAIVGKNGCGKSTLMNVLLRLFDYDHSPPGSQLLFNDFPAELYSPSDIHAHSTAVFQNFSKLSNATVRENAGVGDVDRMAPPPPSPPASAFLDEDEELPESDPDSVVEALKEGGAWGFVRELRDGIETRLDAGGFTGGAGAGRSPSPWSRSGSAGIPRQAGLPPPRQHKVALSGGQWQRIALSRSFMRSNSSDLMILDEASSQLDPRAQNDIFSKVFSGDKRGRQTTIFITHRLSTVRWADKVAFFDEGQIKEFGTHEELLSIPGGGYRDLWDAFVSTGV